MRPPRSGLISLFSQIRFAEDFGRDNADGGSNGPETVLLTDPSVNSQFTYVLGVNDFDFGNSGEDLEMSMAFITVINNVQSFEFPKLSVDTFNMTHHYYFFGCITVDNSKCSRISTVGG